MEKFNPTKIIGIIIFVLGAALFLKALGLVNIPPVPFLSVIWPVGIILIGLGIMSKSNGSTIVLVVIALIIASLILSGELISNMEDAKERIITKEIGLDSQIKQLSVKIDYGAGVVNINGNNKNANNIDNLVLFNDVTTTTEEPIFTYTKDNDKGNLYLARASQSIPPFKNLKDEWSVSFSNNIPLNMDLNYGAAEVNIDMSNLKVSNLDIDTGASESTITFADYPTKVNIDAGMSSFNFKFPTNVGVIIIADNGMSSMSLNNFKEKYEGIFINEYYEENSTNNIEINIDAGMSDFSEDTY